MSFLPASIFLRASVVYHASVIIASVCIQYIYVCNTIMGQILDKSYTVVSPLFAAASILPSPKIV